MKLIIAVLIVLLIGLQYRLWVGEGSMAHRVELQNKIEQQQAENETLRERNRILALEVDALKSNLDAVEERAREQMGMIKKDETFYMIVDPEENKNTNGSSKKENQ
jgi:cell division protein FtsB